MDEDPQFVDVNQPDVGSVEVAPRDSQVKRLAIFLRSVIPSDPWQLIFLVGAIFLFISPRLSWLPHRTVYGTVDGAFLPDWYSGNIRDKWRLIVSIAAWPLVLTSLVAYFSCFWPGNRPARRILWGVVLPTTVCVAVVLFCFFRLDWNPPTVFLSPAINGSGTWWFRSIFTSMPTAIYFCLLGLFLMTLFLYRLVSRKSSLPLSVSYTYPHPEVTETIWPRLRAVIFVLVGPFFFVGSLMGALLLVLMFLFPKSSAIILGPTTTAIGDVVGVTSVVLISIWILGRRGWSLVTKAIRLPEPRFALYSALIPVLISGATGFLHFLIERARWAVSHGAGGFSEPVISQFFQFEYGWQPWLITVVAAAFAEEIIFRGQLLPLLIERYQFQRGVLLTGIVWAAMHFHSDS